MSTELITEYRKSRQDAEDYRLTQTVSLAAEIIIKMASGFYKPEQIDGAWEMIETLLRVYAERRNHG